MRTRPVLARSLLVPLALVFSGAIARADDPAPEKPKAPETPASQVKSEVDELLVRMADPKLPLTRYDAANTAKSVQDPKILPALVKLLKDENVDVRTAAIAALGTREAEDQKKKASEALAGRIKWLEKVESQAELLAVIKSLHNLAQVNAIEALLDGVHDEADRDVVEARVMAVANIPAAEAIETLIDYMARRRRDGSGIPALFARALTSATGERGANDPDVWRKWWRENKATFDFATAAETRKAAENAKAEKEARKAGGGKGGKGGKGEKGEKGENK